MAVWCNNFRVRGNRTDVLCGRAADPDASLSWTVVGQPPVSAVLRGASGRLEGRTALILKCAATPGLWTAERDHYGHYAL